MLFVEGNYFYTVCTSLIDSFKATGLRRNGQ